MFQGTGNKKKSHTVKNVVYKLMTTGKVSATSINQQEKEREHSSGGVSVRWTELKRKSHVW